MLERWSILKIRWHKLEIQPWWWQWRLIQILLPIIIMDYNRMKGRMSNDLDCMEGQMMMNNTTQEETLIILTKTIQINFIWIHHHHQTLLLHKNLNGEIRVGKPLYLTVCLLPQQWITLQCLVQLRKMMNCTRCVSKLTNTNQNFIIQTGHYLLINIADNHKLTKNQLYRVWEKESERVTNNFIPIHQLTKELFHLYSRLLRIFSLRQKKFMTLSIL